MEASGHMALISVHQSDISTDVALSHPRAMGDPAMYPEIRSARNIYALQRLPRDFTADVQARKQWVDNNLTYLDGLLLANFSPGKHSCPPPVLEIP
eukprot:scaffold356_cov135-Isochrysis_galbana.AAC.8